ncbi:hypothetical protein DNU06_04355 [Putridiphycobacter roseus]|uniref:Uncharacterized protein n=2 Tax=Putridiphycobacter roseus TaxID=2219161 RepID=A0A2W1N0S9_9FLAO|nr:hypothetical protein DNU06_04355 [Putridiphycobacter roseus]
MAFTGCKKEAILYKIEGNVSDQISNGPIPNLNIQLFQRVYQSGVLNNNYTYLTEVTADDNGNYAFEFERTLIYDIKLVIEDTKYYTKEVIIEQQDLSTEDVNMVNLGVEAKGWLKMILNNNYVSPDEQLNIFKTGFKTDCEACCTIGNTTFYETGDTSLTCAVTGGSTVKIVYGEATAGSSFTEEIECVRFDTTFFTINY